MIATLYGLNVVFGLLNVWASFRLNWSDPDLRRTQRRRGTMWVMFTVFWVFVLVTHLFVPWRSHRG